MSIKRLSFPLLFLLASTSFADEAQESATESGSDLFEMDLDELLSVEVSQFTLTSTSRRVEPGVSSVHTDYLLEFTGARSIDEIQEMTSPGVQRFRAPMHPTPIGFRGANLSGNGHYFTMVNGRLVNSRLFPSSVGERRTPLLGDIHRIDLLRGPGSVLFGSGALTSVTNIRTHTGLTFQGGDAKLRHVWIERTDSLEARWGESFGPDSGLFLYAGIARKKGARNQDTPVFAGYDFIDPYGNATPAGEAIDLDFQPDHKDRKPQIKLFADYVHGGWEIWSRFVREGEVTLTPTNQQLSREKPPGIAGADFDEESLTTGLYAGSKRWTSQISNESKLNEAWSLRSQLSYAWAEILIDPTPPRLFLADHENRQREQEAAARAIVTWAPNDDLQLAMGADAYYVWSRTESFVTSPASDPAPSDGPPNDGPPSDGPPNDGPPNDGPPNDGPPNDGPPNDGPPNDGPPNDGPPSDAPGASIDGVQRGEYLTYGPMVEAQWRPFDEVTLFAGARADRHDKGAGTDWRFSPRAAIAFAPGQRDTFKAIASRSLLRPQVGETSAESDNVQTLELYELRYLHQREERFLFSAGVYYQRLSPIADTNRIGGQDVTGTYGIGGIEAEIGWRGPRFRLALNHNFTKLLDADEKEEIEFSAFTLEPQGYGDDLTAWSNHQTKFLAIWEALDAMTLNASLALFWGLPGMKDAVRFNSDREAGPAPTLGIYEGNDEPFGPNAYLNLGAQWSPWEWADLRLDLYNALGWVDEKLNKRNYRLFSSGVYRVEAPAIGLSVRASFD